MAITSFSKSAIFVINQLWGTPSSNLCLQWNCCSPTSLNPLKNVKMFLVFDTESRISIFEKTDNVFIFQWRQRQPTSWSVTSRPHQPSFLGKKFTVRCDAVKNRNYFFSVISSLNVFVRLDNVCIELLMQEQRHTSWKCFVLQMGRWE